MPINMNVRTARLYKATNPLPPRMAFYDHNTDDSLIINPKLPLLTVAIMQLFRIFGDLSHTASKLILIHAIHSNRSAEGVSLLTQLLYCLVFGTRYLDLFWVPPWWSWWNFVLKIFYITSSAYIVYLMMRVFARTREREKAWKLTTWSLIGSLVSSPFVCLVFRGWQGTSFTEILWTFSEELESVCVLPQLLLLRQTSVPTVLDTFYLVTLGSYRFFYILNWIVRGIGEKHFDPISITFGIVQTALYADFAWVYWSRQRVKLRGGGVVDSEDLSRSFIVSRIIGRKSQEHDDEDIADEDGALAGQENGTIRPFAQRSGRSWGARGVSVSADDDTLTLPDHEIPSATEMADPARFEDDEDDDAPPPPTKDARYTDTAAAAEPEEVAVSSSAGEWQENVAVQDED